MITTFGREQVRRALPDEYKEWADKPLNKKAIEELTTELAKKDPDAYVDILQRLHAIGENTVSLYGRDAALSFSDAVPSKAIRSLNAQLKALVDKVLDDESLTEEQKEKKIIDLGYKYTQKIQEEVFNDQDHRHTALASQINSGSRGNKTQLMQLMFGNMLMKDAMNRDLPLLHMDPFIFGTSPMAYWVSASAGRKGMYDVQAATGQAGYLGKQVTNVTHDVVIEKDDCGTKDTGMPFKAADPQNIGRVLLRPFHNHPAGEVVDAKMIAEADDDEEMILRTPMTCKCAHGICAKCNGLAENGRFPGIGDYVALTGSRAFVEKITQAGISCLTPDTLVRMGDWSIKRLGDIQVGDSVMGTSLSGEARPAKVTHVFNNGIQPVYRTVYRPASSRHSEDDFYIDSTLNHRIICGNADWGDLVKIDCNEIGQPGRIGYLELAKQIEPEGCTYHEPAAFLLGILCGDGCYTYGHGKGAELACFDDKLFNEMNEYLAPMGMYLRVKAAKSSYGKYRVSDCNRTKGYSPQDRTICRALLEKYGMYGSNFATKKFPNNYKDWNRQSISQFISGLWSADGHIAVHKNGVACILCMANLPLIEQVRDMLHKFWGIPVVHIGIMKKKLAKHHTMYRLAYHNPIVVERLLTEVIKPKGVKADASIEVLDWIRTRKATTVRSPYKCARVSQTYIGMLPVMDIEVANEDHLYLLANGIQSHNSKHGSGVGGKKVVDPEGEDQPTGFAAIERMFQAQENFPGGAVLSPVDGTVSSIRPAPQGGNYITVGSQTMYCSPERTFKVKVGDKVSAGDVLTNGVPNPKEVVEYKGIGQGRRYYMEKLADVFKRAGFGVDRANLEAYSRAAMNKVRITDENGYHSWLPGDVVNYSAIAAEWKPREDAVTEEPDKAANKYLEEPVLYYTIGTRVTPSVAQNLKKYGFGKITVSPTPPPFTSEYMRPAAALQNDEHWLPRLAGERLKDSLFDAARKGITDPYDSTSFVDKIVTLPFK